MKYKAVAIVLVVFMVIVGLWLNKTSSSDVGGQRINPTVLPKVEKAPSQSRSEPIVRNIPVAVLPPSNTSIRPSGRMDYAIYNVSNEYLKIHIQIFAEVQDVITSHPSSEVRVDMVNAMNDRAIGALFFDQSHPFGRGIAVTTVMRIPNLGVRPVICFSADSMLSPSVDIRSKYATMYHEMMHVLQYRDGVMAEQFYPMGPSHEFSQKEAEDYFEMEYEAYVLECRFAIKQGWKAVDPMYKVFGRDGEDAFRKVFPVYLVDTQPRCRPHLPHLMKVASRRKTIRHRKTLSEVPLSQ